MYLKNYLIQTPIISLKTNQHIKSNLNWIPQKKSSMKILTGFLFSIIIIGFLLGIFMIPLAYSYYGQPFYKENIPQKIKPVLLKFNQYHEKIIGTSILKTKEHGFSFQWEGHNLTQDEQWKSFTGLNSDVLLNTNDIKKIREISPRISNHYRISSQAAERIVKEAVIAAKKNKVDPALLLAIVGVESRFNPYAASNVGAIGLTQVLPKWHPEKLDVNNAETILLQTEQNLNIGAQILSEYLEKYDGDVKLALQQYNGAVHDRSQTYAGYVARSYIQIAGRPMPSQHY